MHFDMVIRAKQGYPFDEGFQPQLSISDKLNSYDLSMQSSMEKNWENLKREARKPEFISLEVQIQAQKLTHNPALTVMINNQSKTGRFYETTVVRNLDQSHVIENQHQRIDFFYTSKGRLTLAHKEHAIKGLDVDPYIIRLSEPGLVGHKIFNTQNLQTITQGHKHLGSGNWLVTPPHHTQALLNILPVLSYGGFYTPGCSFNKIRQMYGMISPEENDYGLLIYSRNELAQKHDLQKLMFVDETISDLSLSDCIKRGDFKIELQNKELGESIYYRSFNYHYDFNAAGIFEIDFII